MRSNLAVVFHAQNPPRLRLGGGGKHTNNPLGRRKRDAHTYTFGLRPRRVELQRGGTSHVCAWGREKKGIGTRRRERRRGRGSRFHNSNNIILYNDDESDNCDRRLYSPVRCIYIYYKYVYISAAFIPTISLRILYIYIYI